MTADPVLVEKVRAICRCAQSVWSEAKRDGVYLPFDLAAAITRLDDAQGELIDMVGFVDD